MLEPTLEQISTLALIPDPIQPRERDREVGTWERLQILELERAWARAREAGLNFGLAVQNLKPNKARAHCTKKPAGS